MFDFNCVFDQVEELETAEEVNELAGRVYLGKGAKANYSALSYFYLNHDDSEVERWDARLLDLKNERSFSLTYGIKEFMIQFKVYKTRSQDLYKAYFTNVKKKANEEVNHLTMDFRLENNGEVIQTYKIETDWEKGKPLHSLWEVLANSTLENYLKVENKGDNLVFGSFAPKH